MSLLDGIKGFASELSIQSKENHVKVTLVSGKKCFYLGPLENSVVIRQNEDGFIYFDEIGGTYKITGYEWGGPEYKSITDTTGSTTTLGKSKTKGKVNLDWTAKSKTKSRIVETHIGKTTSYNAETYSVAYMTLKDPETGYTFSFGFKCNSKIHGEILNMLHDSSMEE